MKPFKFSKINSFGRGKIIAATLAISTMVSCNKPEDNPIGLATKKNVNGAKVSIIQDRYIVVFKAGSSKKEVKAMISSIQKQLNQTDLPKLKIDQSDILYGAIPGFIATLTDEQVAFLETTQEVAYIEEDQEGEVGIFQLADSKAAKPNPGSSPTFTDTVINNEFLSYGVRRIGAFSNNIDGTGKTAWIIDSGISFSHPDLNVDTVRDVSFLRSTDGPDFASPEDNLGHGTLIAGIIGAKKGNGGNSVIGVAPNASLVSLRVANANGFYRFSALLLAINHAFEVALPGDAVNISLTAPSTKTLDDAVKKLGGKGVFVAMSAGNTSSNCGSLSPQRANGTNVYTVSAMDKTNTFLPTSNFGNPVDFALPGHQIRTTTMFGSGYVFTTGADIAAPFMTGLLLITNGIVKSDGFVVNDPDNKPDPIARK